MEIWDILYLFALISSLLSFNFKMPGNFLVFIHTVWYKLLSGNPEISTSFIVLLFGLAVMLEFVEYVILAFTMKKYDVSRLTIWLAVFGSLVGTISGAFSSYIIGSLLGGIIGVLLGAVVGELIKNKSHQNVKRAVFSAFLGAFGGLTVKYIGVVSMVSIIIYRIYF
ncbi:MAG: hypothetical protein Kow00108_16010 [Calditrichia bacterium]